MKKAGAAYNQMFPEGKVTLKGCQNDTFDIYLTQPI